MTPTDPEGASDPKVQYRQYLAQVLRPLGNHVNKDQGRGMACLMKKLHS